jgi:hypothetical protein
MSGLTAGALLLSPMGRFSGAGTPIERSPSGAQAPEAGSADYTLHIQTSAIEIAPKRIISLVTYNGQFPGPVLRQNSATLNFRPRNNVTSLCALLIQTDLTFGEGHPF